MKSIKGGAEQRPSARWVALVALACCLAATGCSTSKAKRARTDAEVRRLTEFWEPHKLYLNAFPHSRLHVEVDAVEGYSPSEETLGKLREFLRNTAISPAESTSSAAMLFLVKMRLAFCRARWRGDISAGHRGARARRSLLTCMCSSTAML